MIYASYSKLSTELKDGINIFKCRPSSSWVIGQAVIDQDIILTVLIHNFKTTWPTKLSMPFLSSLDNLL